MSYCLRFICQTSQAVIAKISFAKCANDVYMTLLTMAMLLLYEQ